MNSQTLICLLAISSVLLLLLRCKCTHATPAVNQRGGEHWKPVTLSLNEMVAPVTAESSELLPESTGGAAAKAPEPELFSGLDFELSTETADVDAAADSAAEEESRAQLSRMEVELALRLEAIRAAIDEARVKTRAENTAAAATEEEADEEAEDKRATSQHSRDALTSVEDSHFGRENPHWARARMGWKNENLHRE